MKFLIPVEVDVYEDITPGAAYHVGRKSIKYVRRTLIARKIVETKSGVRVVFDNGTWRPLTTYNKTWWKA